MRYSRKPGTGRLEVVHLKDELKAFVGIEHFHEIEEEEKRKEMDRVI